MKHLLPALLALAFVGCSRTPEEKLHRYIDEQGAFYRDAALQELGEHYSPEFLAEYEYDSTHTGLDPDGEGGHYGYVYVLFAKKGTRVRERTGPNSSAETFDSLQVNFESFDTYRSIEFVFSDEGKSTRKEVFAESFPENRKKRSVPYKTDPS